ncbi:MAG: glycosyltransferase family 4 protein [Anaerolineae bacterium]|nr:glycosyltransferase family 4 protein [Anaerolineae bacterium]
MKVLIAVHGFPPTHRAGAERAAERIAKWLAANQHHVEIMALEDYESPEFHIEEDTYEGIPCHRVYYNIGGEEQGSRKRYDNPVIGEAFRNVLAQGDYDLVHMVSGYLLGVQVTDIARELGIPVVITLTEYWFMCARLNLLHANGTLCKGPTSPEKCAVCLLEDKRRYRLPRQYFPKLTKRFWSMTKNTPLLDQEVRAVRQRQDSLHETLDATRLVISPSHFLMDKFAEFGFDTSNWVMVRHGIDNVPMPTEKQCPDGPLRLGYIGQLKPHKGIDLVVNAALRLLGEGKNLTLDIWGGLPDASPYLQQLHTRAEPFEQIHWCGSFDGSQLWDVLRDIDVLVVPSQWYENCPTVILEANRVNVPVVATNLGGMAELVHHEESGLLFELGDLDDLTHQLRRLCDEPELLHRLSDGIPYVRTSDDEIADIYAHYCELLDTTNIST